MWNKFKEGFVEGFLSKVNFPFPWNIFLSRYK